MNNYSKMRRVPVPSKCVVAIAMLINGLAVAQPVRSQQTQPPPPPSSMQNPPSPQQVLATADSVGAKKRKVWTNEDLVALRSPADIYILEKEAREAAEAEAAEKAAAEKEAAAKNPANPANQAGSGVQLPTTEEETEKKMKETESDLQDDTATVTRLKGELPDTTAEQQAEKQKQIDHITADIDELQRELQALQEHLKTFAPKPEERPSPPPAGPPQSN